MTVNFILKTSLIAGALLVLSGFSSVLVSCANPAPRPTLNILPKFYKANPAVPEQPAVYRTVDACYRLVDWSDLVSTQNKYLKKDYVQLGHCDFTTQSGIPLTDNAVVYGRYLGADIIIYAVHQTPEGKTEHYISYLIKS